MIFRTDVSTMTKTNLRALIVESEAARKAFFPPCAHAEVKGDGSRIHFSTTDDAVVEEFLAWCEDRGIELVQETEVMPLLWYDATVSPDQAMEFKIRWRGAEK